MQATCIIYLYGYTMSMRISRTQQNIITLLEKNHLMSMKDMHEHLAVNFSTVFRSVEHLCDKQILKKVIANKDIIVYELADHAHDHFVCDDCGDIRAVELSRGSELMHMGKVSDIIIHGTCNDCLA